jgi:hypothetical protein
VFEKWQKLLFNYTKGNTEIVETLSPIKDETVDKGYYAYNCIYNLMNSIQGISSYDKYINRLSVSEEDDDGDLFFSTDNKYYKIETSLGIRYIILTNVGDTYLHETRHKSLSFRENPKDNEVFCISLNNSYGYISLIQAREGVTEEQVHLCLEEIRETVCKSLLERSCESPPKELDIDKFINILLKY